MKKTWLFNIVLLFVAIRSSLLSHSKEILMRQTLSSILFLCLLVLPLAAQEEALHGTWETTIVDDEFGESTIRLTFQADGTFDYLMEPEGEVEGLVGDEEIDPDERAAAEALIESITPESIRFTGTYQVAGNSLYLEPVASEVVLVNGETIDFVEFFTRLVRTIIVPFFLAFAEEDLSEEDYAALEQELVAELLADSEEVEADFLPIGTYAIEGDTLSITITTETIVTDITTGEETVETTVETLEFHRIDAATTVTQTSWGSLKAAWRP